MTSRRAGVLVWLVSAALAGCALGPDYVRPEGLTPDRWQAALPHDGRTAALVDWWAAFDDPLVAELIDVAEHDSPSLDQALARIRQSRSEVTVARSTLYPEASLSASRTRSGDRPVTFEQTLRRGALDASWEIDLFGGIRRRDEAAQARLEGATAAWHDARISLAAEVALEYVGLRACEARLADAVTDHASRRITERLTLAKARAGFAAPAEASLAQASAADGATRRLALEVECALGVKALVALTGLPENDLQQRLAPGRARLPQPAALVVDAVPVRVLSARPDVAVAERGLAAASAGIGVAEAARYPRLSLLGMIGRQWQTVDGSEASGRIWSFGPALDLPLFDAGRRAAQAEAARARYDEALAAYKGVVRKAVREVEQSLVRLGSVAERQEQARRAAEHYDEALVAADARWRIGLGSQLELEEVRRMAVAARSQYVSVRLDGVAAWIGLYRAVGGAWNHAAEPLTHESETRP